MNKQYFVKSRLFYVFALIILISSNILLAIATGDTLKYDDGRPSGWEFGFMGDKYAVYYVSPYNPTEYDTSVDGALYFVRNNYGSSVPVGLAICSDTVINSNHYPNTFLDYVDANITEFYSTPGWFSVDFSKVTLTGDPQAFWVYWEWKEDLYPDIGKDSGHSGYFAYCSPSCKY